MRPRVVVPILLTLAGGLAALALLAGGPPPAEAGSVLTEKDPKLGDLAKYAKGGAALNLRLQALEKMRKDRGTTVEAELKALAGSDDLRIAIYATTTLGRRKTDAAKTALKALVTDTRSRTEVRKAAMTAVVKHWGSSADASWILDRVGSDSTLKAHYLWLESHVGWK